MQPSMYEKELRIPYYLGDRYGQANLPQLMNILIEVSGEQITELNAKPARKLGLRWVVIQYELNIERIPKTNEKIKVRTFVEGYNRIFSYRKFEVYDEDNHLLIDVTAAFSLIDENRKLSRIPKEIISDFDSPEERRIRRTPKPEISEDIETAKFENYKVRYFDIDTNFHANNSLYFIWMLDALGDDFLTTHELIGGNIVFEKEVHIGEKVNSYADVKEAEDETFISQHKIEVEGITKCVANFEWK